MRRVIIVLVLLTVVGGVAWVLLRWDRTALSSADSWRAVPAEAAVIMEVPTALAAWDRFTHTSLHWRAWEQEPGAKRLASALARMSQMMEADQELRAAMSDATVLVALLRSGKGIADPLFIGSGSGASMKRLAALFGIDAAHEAGLTEGRSVPCTTDSALLGLHVCSRDGLWMLSPSITALDEAMLQLERGTPITDDALFAKARATLDAATEASVLVHTGRACGLLGAIWEPRRIEQLAIPQGWLALEFTSGPDAMTLSGLLVPAAPDAFTTSLAAQGSGDWNIGRLVPADAVIWEVRHVGDIGAAMDACAALDDRARATEIISGWMQGSVGVAQGSRDSSLWFVAEAADPERATEELLSPCAQSPCDTMSHRGTRITRMPEAAPFELLLGRHAGLPQQPWWAVLGHHVVMSDDPAAVRASIDAWNDGGSLAEQSRAKEAFKRLSDDAGCTWWLDPMRGGESLKQGLLPARQDGFGGWMPLLRRVSTFAVQASPAPEGLLHVMVSALHAGEDGEAMTAAPSTGVLWQCTLNAPVSRRPFLVRNHTNGTLETLVQDQEHRIHLISATGKSLWSRPLDGPILGAVHQVDRFKNGKLQVLLGTATTLHLIDRNGKDVGVPHKLKADAAAPLAVMDYDGKSEFRILVPLTDGRLLNLDLDFAPVEGWTTPKLDAPAVDAVRHLRIGGKDHLLAVDAEGVVRLFDRKGNAREPVKARLDRVKQVLAVESGQALGGTRIIWMDQDLALKATRMDGDQTGLPGGEARDLDGDGNPELLTEERADVVKNGAAITVGEVLALAELDAVGHAWRFAPSAIKAPAAGDALFAVGDLNLDGTNELMGADGTPVITAFRLPSP